VSGEAASGGPAWIAPTGHEVHGQVSRVGFQDIDARFLNRLRLLSFIFSGYHLTNLLGTTSHPHWNDAFGTRYRLASEPAAPHWCLPYFKEMIRSVPEECIYSPPLVMGEIGHEVGGRCVNLDTVSYQERINLLHESGLLSRLREQPHPVILEIGAGYGALASHLLKVVPRATYLLVDLPRSLIFSLCYLATTLPGLAGSVHDGSARALEAGSWVAVPNLLLPTLQGIGLDLAINTMSFAEMPEGVVATYAKFIAAHLKPGGSLFEQNYDNSHLPHSNFSNPARILAAHFPVCRQVPDDTLWGTARIWKGR